MSEDSIIVFTDGASRGNPGPGGWGAVIALLPSARENDRSVIERGGGARSTTNNRMELTAAIEALVLIKEQGHDGNVPITVYTDSQYVINGITTWVKGWERNGWTKKDKSSIKNLDLWKDLRETEKSMTVAWVHVEGHTGVAGNERADEIATAFADGKEFPLKTCPYAEYDVDLFSLLPSASDVRMKTRKKERSSKKAYSYVSAINKKVQVHSNWEACKERVSGVSGARFRKVFSKEEEEELCRRWSA